MMPWFVVNVLGIYPLWFVTYASFLKSECHIFILMNSSALDSFNGKAFEFNWLALLKTVQTETI